MTVVPAQYQQSELSYRVGVFDEVFEVLHCHHIIEPSTVCNCKGETWLNIMLYEVSKYLFAFGDNEAQARTKEHELGLMKIAAANKKSD